jgi:hypothetical protein
MRNEDMTDAALDEEIARAIAVDPSPAFVARIRQHVAAERMTRAGTRWWMAVASGPAVATAIVLAIAWHGEPVVPPSPPLLTHTIPGADVPVVVSGTRVVDGTHVVVPANARPKRRGAPMAGAEPEVLVDPREARALHSVLADVGRIDVTVLIDTSQPAVMDVGPVRDIYIAPIEWAPLTKEGVL